MRKSGDPGTKEVRYSPKGAEPPGTVVKRVIQIQQQRTARTEFSAETADRAFRVRNVVKHTEGEDEVEVAIREGQSIRCGLNECNVGGLHVGSRNLKGGGARINGDEPIDPRRDHHGPST